jgi:hypothetical protein
MKKPPCYNCLERHTNCHANCEKYSAWKLEREKEKAIIREFKKQDEENFQFRFASYRRTARKNGKKV